MWWIAACTFEGPAPDVVYGGGRIWGEMTLSDEFDEGPIGTFEIEGTDDPAGFDFDDCDSGGALRLGNDAIHERVTACFQPDEMEGFDLKEVRRWCGIDDYGPLLIDFEFDEDGKRIWTIDPVMEVIGSPAGGLEAWSQSSLSMNDVETHGMSVYMTHVDWVIMAAEEEGCDKHLGILGTGTATVSWEFDPEVRAVLE
ncbi:MAG TPA: hypothetical protein QGF58_28375 [Myxococcota bacterium]|nr:hypothetical protein [Myxococcota bacterium]